MPDYRQAMWVMYDMCINHLPRTQAFERLRQLGMSRRDAAELIQEHEREG
jgi:hypothetical protein